MVTFYTHVNAYAICLYVVTEIKFTSIQDLNGHVGKSAEGCEESYDEWGYGIRRSEGERILESVENLHGQSSRREQNARSPNYL